jgi:hypothetical protein
VAFNTAETVMGVGKPSKPVEVVMIDVEETGLPSDPVTTALEILAFELVAEGRGIGNPSTP